MYSNNVDIYKLEKHIVDIYKLEKHIAEDLLMIDKKGPENIDIYMKDGSIKKCISVQERIDYNGD
jgi:hypothetical protein